MTKESEKRHRGGFVLTFERGRSETIDAALRYRKQEATEAFSARDWKLHHKELVLLSFSLGSELIGSDQTIDGAALMERMAAPVRDSRRPDCRIGAGVVVRSGRLAVRLSFSTMP